MISFRSKKEAMTIKRKVKRHKRNFKVKIAGILISVSFSLAKSREIIELIPKSAKTANKAAKDMAKLK